MSTQKTKCGDCENLATLSVEFDHKIIRYFCNKHVAKWIMEIFGNKIEAIK